MATMYLEHCGQAVADREIFATNYGVTTTPFEEWKAAAGR